MRFPLVAALPFRSRVLPMAGWLLLAASPALAQDATHVFAPDVVSGPVNDFAPAFSPREDRLLFTRGSGGPSFILETTRHGLDGWAPPEPATFSGRAVDLEPTWSPDGSYVVFASDRGNDGQGGLKTRYYGQEQIGGNLWRVERRGHGWGTPRRLAAAINQGTSVWSPALAGKDVLYFMATDPITGRFRLHRAARASSAKPALFNLPFSTGTANDVDPYVTPNEDLLIFSSDRGNPADGDAPGPERLFVVLGPRSPAPAVCPLSVPGWEDSTVSMVEPRLSRDRQTLFFASRRLAHEPGEGPKGDWDDGKANIWATPFSPRLWTTSASASAACAGTN